MCVYMCVCVCGLNKCMCVGVLLCHIDVRVCVFMCVGVCVRACLRACV